VLPSLLAGVDSRAWRTKQGSVQMLGAMAYCAPKQLGTALPAVVPKLSEALSDPHPKVQQAARQALKEARPRRARPGARGSAACRLWACILCIEVTRRLARGPAQVGSVIQNPEVQRLSPTLLAAIADPNKHAKTALEVLLSTVFIHAVDAASLALIVPVVHRGLRDRSGDAKKRSGRIVGTMCALINEPKVRRAAACWADVLSAAAASTRPQPACARAQDMAPYVPLLMPDLRAALVDPLPEVRGAAVRSAPVPRSCHPLR